MEKTQNVTLAITEDLLRKANLLAEQRNTTLSVLLTQALADMVPCQEGYEQARQHNLELLRRGFNFGTQGDATWKRAKLHERQPECRTG